MRATQLLRLALAGGRVDGLRIVLTAFGAALATILLLGASSVVAIVGQAHYANALLAEPGLRPGVTTALLLIGVPVIFFVGQCVRVGAPARDRRLAAVRMAGATPAQTMQLAAVETGLAAALGTVVGFALFLLGRVVLSDPGPVRRLPTDVLAPWWVLIGIALIVPVGSVLLAALALRATAFTPFGVVRRRPARPPRVLPAVLFFGGTLALAFPLAWGLGTDRLWVPQLIEGILLVVALVGLVTGGAAVSAAVGRWVAGRAKRPAVLLAARWLVADPWAASRTLPAVLAAVLVGAGAMVFRAFTLASISAESEAWRRLGERTDDDPTRTAFFAHSFDLAELAVGAAIVVAALGLLVATIEQILERRRTLAALSAQGTPAGVLARALLLRTALPLVPGVLLAAFAGTVAARGLVGAGQPLGKTQPWLGLTVLTVGTVLVALLICAVGLVLLRRATDVGELRTAA